MSVLVVGMSHQSAPVTLLERLSMDSEVQGNTCGKLLEQGSLSESMIISTCNRMEVYAVTNSFHTGVQDVVRVLQDVSGVDEETLRGYLYVRYADAAAEHLMTVTSGLDSMVVGEQQIIGQVRGAYQSAAEQGTAGPRIHALAQSALHTGKRVHTETAIDEAGSSMVSFAFDAALTLRGTEDLSGATVVILGAGAMASLAATHAGRLGAAQLVIANRTRERAERLASHSIEAGVPAVVVDYEQRATAFADADVIVSATGANSFTISPADVTGAAAGEPPRLLVDLSLPRDIDDACGDIDGVELVNIEKLSATLQSPANSDGPHAHARKIVREELDAFCSAQRVLDVVPAVSALRQRAADLVECEVARLDAKFPDMSEEQREGVNRALKRLSDKLLHEPTVRAKQLAATSGSVTHENALQQLFGLDLDTPELDGVAVAVEKLPKLDERAGDRPAPDAR